MWMWFPISVHLKTALKQERCQPAPGMVVGGSRSDQRLWRRTEALEEAIGSAYGNDPSSVSGSVLLALLLVI